jgi:hypothetical protein
LIGFGRLTPRHAARKQDFLHRDWCDKDFQATNWRRSDPALSEEAPVVPLFAAMAAEIHWIAAQLVPQQVTLAPFPEDPWWWPA